MPSNDHDRRGAQCQDQQRPRLWHTLHRPVGIPSETASHTRRPCGFPALARRTDSPTTRTAAEATTTAERVKDLLRRHRGERHTHEMRAAETARGACSYSADEGGLPVRCRDVAGVADCVVRSFADMPCDLRGVVHCCARGSRDVVEDGPAAHDCTTFGNGAQSDGSWIVGE
jgi:hypothetical protein